jgi:hypothetical protein
MAHNRPQAVTKLDVRFGSLADICSAKGHVRFAPNSDRETGFQQTVMSALPPKADMCGATGDVRFGPIADIDHVFHIGPLERKKERPPGGGLSESGQPICSGGRGFSASL